MTGKRRVKWYAEFYRLIVGLCNDMQYVGVLGKILHFTYWAPVFNLMSFEEVPRRQLPSTGVRRQSSKVNSPTILFCRLWKRVKCFFHAHYTFFDIISNNWTRPSVPPKKKTRKRETGNKNRALRARRLGNGTGSFPEAGRFRIP